VVKPWNKSLINGNAAFFNKSDVPTYLVGTQSRVEELLEIVRTPSEVFTHLGWLHDTADVDAKIAAFRAAEKTAAAAARAGPDAG